MELFGAVKNYDWGQLGHNSIVAKLGAKNNPNFIADDEQPYAEFWMGTHPNGPATLKLEAIPLKQYIAENPSCLGTLQTFGTDLSFLLKVLSVRKALSIQVHPNKEDAAKLMKRYPALYSDENHKPELAVALTNFEALCGFRTLEEISNFMKNIPELCHLIDDEERCKFIECPSVPLLKTCFSSYITANPVEARKSAARLIDRLSGSDFGTREAQLEKLFTRLNNQFPGDIGLFAIYFLNYVTLEPGEAIFLGAGTPHAYIYGDCVEIMALSDNVVRAGLTPKARDIPTLLEIIEYVPVSIEEVKFQGRIFDKYIHVFTPPVADFALSRICVPKGDTYTLPVKQRASIIVVIKGSADCELKPLKQGIVLFLPSGVAMTFTVKKDLEMYQAYPNV